MNPAMEQMLLQWMSKRTGTPIAELQSASRLGPAALAQRLGIDVPPGMLDVTAHEADDDDDDDPPPRAPSNGRMAAIRKHMADVDARMRELEDAHRQLATRLERVAGTLGACAACFGSDPDCPECEGDGGPGRVASRYPRTLRRWLRGLGVQLPQPSPAPTASD
jgi:hypothetical protein